MKKLVLSVVIALFAIAGIGFGNPVQIKGIWPPNPNWTDCPEFCQGDCSTAETNPGPGPGLSWYCYNYTWVPPLIQNGQVVVAGYFVRTTPECMEAGWGGFCVGCSDCNAVYRVVDDIGTYELMCVCQKPPPSNPNP